MCVLDPAGLDFGLDLLVCLPSSMDMEWNPQNSAVKRDSQKDSPSPPLLSH